MFKKHCCCCSKKKRRAIGVKKFGRIIIVLEINERMVLITEIEDRKIVKPYLGGWRNKITGDKYLNAASQTGPPPKNISWHDCCSIGVQTVETKDETTQSSRNKITQMWRLDNIRKLKYLTFIL